MFTTWVRTLSNVTTKGILFLGNYLAFFTQKTDTSSLFFCVPQTSPLHPDPEGVPNTTAVQG